MLNNNQQPSLSMREFESVLKFNGIVISNPEVVKNIYNFFVSKGMNFEAARKFVTGAKRRDRLTAEWIKKDETGAITTITYADAKKQDISVRELARSKAYLTDAIRNHSEQADRILFERLAEIDAKFKQVYKERKQFKVPRLDITIRSLYEAVKRHGKIKNESLEIMLESEVEKLYNLAGVYSALARHFNEDPSTPNRSADYVMGKRLASLIEDGEEIIIDSSMEQRVDQVLSTLESAKDNLPEEEKFTAKELQQLFRKVTSLVYTTDAVKTQGVRVVLRSYLDELKSRAEDPKAKEFLSEATAKKIILKAGTLLNQTAESLEEATMFMLGNTAREVFKKRGNGAGERNKKRKEFAENFPGFKVDGFTIEKQLYLIKNNPSSLININILNIIQANTEIVNLLAEAFGVGKTKTQAEKVIALREIGIDPERLIHADNVVDLLQRKRASEKFSGSQNIVLNIKTLSKFMPPIDIQKIVKHNYAFLYQNPEWINQKLKEIYKKNSKDYKGLKHDFEALVNSFYKYADPNSKDGKTSVGGDNEFEETVGVGGVKFSNKKEHIDLNLFALTEGLADGAKRKVNVAITKENYREILYLELAELKAYLDSKQQNKRYEPQKNTVAYELYRCGNETDTDQTKGAFKRKYMRLAEMSKFMIEDESTPVGFVESLALLSSAIDMRSESLKLTIAESESIADPIAQNFKNKVMKNNEREKDYLNHITLLETQLKEIKGSSKLKEHILEEKNKYEELLEELRIEKIKLAEEKQWMLSLYQGRSSWKIEQKFLGSLYTLIATVGDEIKNKKTSKKTNTSVKKEAVDNVEIQIKKREIECLEAVVKDNKQRYGQTYLTDRDKLGSHAKKWSGRIQETEAKIERLKQELKIMLQGEQINTD